MFLHQEHLGTI